MVREQFRRSTSIDVPYTEAPWELLTRVEAVALRAVDTWESQVTQSVEATTTRGDYKGSRLGPAREAIEQSAAPLQSVRMFYVQHAPSLFQEPEHPDVVALRQAGSDEERDALRTVTENRYSRNLSMHYEVNYNATKAALRVATAGPIEAEVVGLLSVIREETERVLRQKPPHSAPPKLQETPPTRAQGMFPTTWFDSGVRASITATIMVTGAAVLLILFALLTAKAF